VVGWGVPDNYREAGAPRRKVSQVFNDTYG
jgi:hypothetical protein